MLKDFNIGPFKKMKPPSNSSFDTAQELNELKKIPLKKDFVKKFDNIETANERLKSKGSRPYNSKMSIAKIEN